MGKLELNHHVGQGSLNSQISRVRLRCRKGLFPRPSLRPKTKKGHGEATSKNTNRVDSETIDFFRFCASSFLFAIDLQVYMHHQNVKRVTLKLSISLRTPHHHHPISSGPEVTKSQSTFIWLFPERIAERDEGTFSVSEESLLLHVASILWIRHCETHRARMWQRDRGRRKSTFRFSWKCISFEIFSIYGFFRALSKCACSVLGLDL